MPDVVAGFSTGFMGAPSGARNLRAALGIFRTSRCRAVMIETFAVIPGRSFRSLFFTPMTVSYVTTFWFVVAE